MEKIPLHETLLFSLRRLPSCDCVHGIRQKAAMRPFGGVRVAQCTAGCARVCEGETGPECGTAIKIIVTISISGAEIHFQLAELRIAERLNGPNARTQDINRNHRVYQKAISHTHTRTHGRAGPIRWRPPKRTAAQPEDLPPERKESAHEVVMVVESTTDRDRERRRSSWTEQKSQHLFMRKQARAGGLK